MAASASLVFAGKSVAAPAISFLITKAFSYLNEYCKSEGMDEVKNRLLMAMPKIQAVFDVVNPERVREQSSALDAWLWQLRDAVEEAEDAVDELEYYELEEKAKDQKVTDWGSSFGKMKHKFLRSVKHTSILDKTLKKLNHRDTLKKLKKAVDGLDKAAAGATPFLTLTDHLNGGASSSQQQVQLVNHDRQTGSTLSATRFIGREKEKEQIIGWLKTSVESVEIVTSTSSVPIISVVGHGGMGKTTLVQSICAEDVVLKHFKVIWVTISTSFDATSVTSKILECATGAKPSATLLEPLQQDLKEKLKSVNFLLVLDDVWEDNKRDEWEKLFAPLRKVNTGSIILLTTRMHSVVDMAASVMGVERDQCLILEGLKGDENIELFNHHVFSSLNSRDHVQLKSTGEQIVKKLGGCPLVTKIVGGHLQDNPTREYWIRFMDEGLEHYKGTEEDVMKVLRLSYYHLPTDLQICFRYCCIFPQDYEFRKKELVQMWMGSGLISQLGCDLRTLEDNGEQLLARLTRKSFFDLKCDWKGEYYVMHDLIHDLARNVSSGECARITDPAKYENEKGTVRHLCIASIQSFSVDEIKKISHFMNLRTLIIDDSVEVGRDLVCAFGKIVESSKSLRLFHSKLKNTSHIAYKFDNLKHLRYIHLHQISPDGIRGVVKLYHLMLLHCYLQRQTKQQKQTKQVRYLGNLERLRYVSYGVHMLGEFPISRLTCLQELDNYQIKESIGNKVSAIRSLRDLRKLKLQRIENVVNLEEAKNAKLQEKQHLSSLSLNWSACTGAENRRDDLVLDHLEPHCNIRELHISNYEGLKLPIWIENMSIKNLVSLKLESCINWEHLPSLGELVLLKLLILDNLPKLKQIGQSSHMSSSSSMVVLLPPSLVSLLVRQCQELCEFPILPPSLVQLDIDNVGLTKLPKIGKIFSESTENKPPQLRRITVTNCSCLISLEGSLLEQGMYMGALRIHDLRIKNCIHLESASIPFEEMSGLARLEISNCPKLRTIRDAKDKLLPSSLRYLNLMQCGNVEFPLLGSLQRLTNLSELKLKNCSRLVSLPSAEVFNTSLKSLRDLVLVECENLSSLGGLGSLPSLTNLTIKKCSKLVEAGLSQTADVSPTRGEEEHLVEPGSSLQICNLVIDLPSLLLVEPLKSHCHTELLEIGDGSEMESFPEGWLLQNRSSLGLLSIRNAKSLESLPPSMRDLSSLTYLDVGGAEQLQSLPDLPSSLKELTVGGAKLLQSLPDLPSSLRELTVFGAEQLQSLPDLPSSVQYLDISNCNSKLEKKSRQHFHIPQVRLGGSYFIMGKECSGETFDSLR